LEKQPGITTKSAIIAITYMVRIMQPVDHQYALTKARWTLWNSLPVHKGLVRFNRIWLQQATTNRQSHLKSRHIRFCFWFKNASYNVQ